MASGSRFDDLKRKVYLDLLGLQEVCINAVNKLRGSTEQPRSMSGITTLITGGNAGIGRATAEELVKRGSDIVIACRNHTTAEETASSLRQLSPYFDTLGTVEVADVDLGSFQSVRSLISTLSARKKPFDCIIANSGIMTPPSRLETKDGFEQQFQVNFLSHFLLMSQLLKNAKPEYERTGRKPRCVFLSSMAHFGATLEKDLDGDLQAKISYNPFTCYANSKLCQLLAAKEFHFRMNGGSGEFPPGGTAVAVHPGIVDTVLARQYFKQRVPKVLLPIASPILDTFFFPMFLKTPKAAAECVLFAATAPAAEVGGQYIQECAVAKSSRSSHDVALAGRLWKKAEQLAGLEEE